MEKKLVILFPWGDKMRLKIRKMKLTVLLTFLVIASYGSGFTQVTVSIHQNKANITDVLSNLEQKTDFIFLYKDNIFQGSKEITVDFDEANFEEVLRSVCEQANVNYEVRGKQIILTSKPNVSPTIVQQQPQKRTISGTVKDERGQPIPGASVVVQGTTTGQITDAEGKFSFEAPVDAKILEFSFVGMEKQEVNITGRGAINITMRDIVQGLDEIVVVGYGTQRKIDLTGAVDVVSEAALKNRPSASVGVLLQGQSPNLNISPTQLGGEPGSPTSFNIRGYGTLSGSSAPLILVDGVEMNINNLDPDAIESVSVLKDAASASIYGSRAPFGVVLITTKKGTKNKGISISYSNNLAWASPTYLPKWQSSIRYVTAYNQSLENSGQPDKFLPPQIDRINRYIAGTYKPEYDTINPPQSIWAGRHQGNANWDWWDVYFKDVTFNQKHNINLSGGDEKTQYYINAGMYDQGGSYNFAKEYYRRYNILANLTSQATSWLRLSLNTKYTNSQSLHPNAGSDWDPDRNFVMSEMIKFFPTTPFYNVNGTINNPYVCVLGQAGPATLDENDLFVSLGSEIEPIKGWKTNVNYTYNFTGSKNTWLDAKITTELPTGVVSSDWWVDPDYYTERWNNNNYESFNALTSYEKTINNHYFKAMIGYERESKYFSNIYGMRYNLITEEVPSFSTATGTFNLDDAKSHWGTEAYFGRLNYNYKEKYLLELNGRYNGSSRFAKDSRWGFFPSGAVGYNISKESFWKSIEKYVNNLKIRVSYGSLGNQNVPNYLYLSNVPIYTNLDWILNNQRPNYAGLPDIISPTLTWETINTFNIGADARFLKNRLGLTFDWYQRNTLNMFGPAMILPASLGTNPPQENNASLSTKGWEISLDWKDRINADVNYSVRLTLADSRTQVTKYLNTTGLIDEFYVGRDLGEIWGYTTAGLIQTAEEASAMPDQSYIYSKWGPGDIKYTDLNGDNKIDDGTRTLDDHGDLKVIGNTSPRYSIGFTGTVSWKNFDFSMFWQGILKRDFWPYGNEAWGVGTRGDNGGAFYQGHDNYWRPADETNLFGPNTNAYYAKPYVTTETYKNQEVQSRFLLNASYFRLKNIQLGYTVPKNLTNKIKLQTIKVYVSGENLLTFDKMPAYIDPETCFVGSSMLGATYPISKSISFGLNVTF
jgi:TonB-linked SusC/RagA family outer membrane protein